MATEKVLIFYVLLPILEKVVYNNEYLKNILNCSLSFRRAPHPKPPLCKGRWSKSSILTGGVVNPSVKNQRFLPAPFTQGSLWTLPRQCV